MPLPLSNPGSGTCRVSKRVASVVLASLAVLGDILRRDSPFPQSCLQANNLFSECRTLKSECYMWKGFCEGAIGENLVL